MLDGVFDDGSACVHACVHACHVCMRVVLCVVPCVSILFYSILFNGYATAADPKL